MGGSIAKVAGGCRGQVARFQNAELCRLTEQVIFTDPYYEAPVNSHTSPQLDALAEQFRADAEAKVAATRLKVSTEWSPRKFATCRRLLSLVPGQ